MSKTDLTIKHIGTLLDQKLKPVNARLDKIEKRLQYQGFTLETHTKSLVNIEDKVKILPDLMTRTVEYSEKIEDHEERIAQLESSSKF